MAEASTVLTIVFSLLGALAFIAFVLSRFIYVVHQAEGIVLERLGTYSRILPSGMSWVAPWEQPRSFNWSKTYLKNGRIHEEITNDYRVDMRESTFNFPRCRVYTKDTIELDVNSIMYYRITDLRKAIYEVDDLKSAISNFAQTQLKEVFGDMTFAQAIVSQHRINEYMQEGFGPRFAKWGVKVERMELLEVTPLSGIADAMKKQMVAERERRGEFIEAEGRKAAMRIQSEGTKMRALNVGLAEQDATRKQSEGIAGSKVEMARAERQALDMVAETLKADGAKQTDYMVAQKYMELARSIPKSAAKQTIYLPYEQANLTGALSALPGVYGSRAVAPKAEMLAPAVSADGGAAESKAGDFDDLS